MKEEWKQYSFTELREFVESNGVVVRNEASMLDYLKERGDNVVEYIGNGQYKIKFS